jgi:hypothetical protein
VACCRKTVIKIFPLSGSIISMKRINTEPVSGAVCLERNSCCSREQCRLNPRHWWHDEVCLTAALFTTQHVSSFVALNQDTCCEKLYRSWYSVCCVQHQATTERVGEDAYLGVHSSCLTFGSSGNELH